jgi:hypothetical protein
MAVQPETRRFRDLTLKLVTIILVSVTALATGLFALDASGIDLNRHLWLLKIKVFGNEPVGIFRDDDIYGWTHIPLSVGRQRVVPDYDVIYHIDSEGNRYTPLSPTPDSPEVLFLGGSFTFGHGVNDSETYPAVLQRDWPDLKVTNAATNAWGTAQAYLRLNDALATGKPPVLIVYGLISHHFQRNYLRKQWLDRLIEIGDRRNPYFTLTERSHPTFQGLANAERDGIENSRELFDQEILITEKLIETMARRCTQKGVPFVVVILPDGTKEFGAAVIKRAAGDRRRNRSSPFIRPPPSPLPARYSSAPGRAPGICCRIAPDSRGTNGVYEKSL